MTRPRMMAHKQHPPLVELPDHRMVYESDVRPGCVSVISGGLVGLGLVWAFLSALFLAGPA